MQPRANDSEPTITLPRHTRRLQLLTQHCVINNNTDDASSCRSPHKILSDPDLAITLLVPADCAFHRSEETSAPLSDISAAENSGSGSELTALDKTLLRHHVWRPSKGAFCGFLSTSALICKCSRLYSYISQGEGGYTWIPLGGDIFIASLLQFDRDRPSDARDPVIRAPSSCCSGYGAYIVDFRFF
jgi:hypothetical protein